MIGPPDSQLPEKGLGGSTGFFIWTQPRLSKSLSLVQAQHPPSIALPGGHGDF